MISHIELDATELRDRLARGALRAAEFAETCLARIKEQEASVEAWAWHDRNHVMRQAQALDEYRASGRQIGQLHGLPIGIKDIIDTAGLPTENGTELDAGRTPGRDAFVTARLKQAGALIMGKTVTTELAAYHPGKTRNPHNPKHTPGGSSSGSAAAVAAGMIPLAIGTQTNGSVIRPAAFCGVVGYKPTFGAIPRVGVLEQAASLDTIGVFARSVEDAALLAETLFGFDPNDSATRPHPIPNLLATAGTEPPVAPVFAMVRQPGWDECTPDLKEAFGELEDALGEHCEAIELPGEFADAVHQHKTVHLAEMSKAFHRYERRGRSKLSPLLQANLDEGKKILARDYLAARDWVEILNAGLEAVFARFDAIITPAAPGPAPAGLERTGNPIYNGLWTFCGTPAITLPLLQAESGLPMGVQLVARRGDDARLLRNARWLSGKVMQAN